MKPRFDIFEIVTINTQKPKWTHLNGKRAAVLGGEKYPSGKRYYVVHIYEDDSLGAICFDEDELLPTGEFDKRETFYSGESIRVSVDPETGEGKIEP